MGSLQTIHTVRHLLPSCTVRYHVVDEEYFRVLAVFLLLQTEVVRKVPQLLLLLVLPPVVVFTALCLTFEAFLRVAF